MRNQAKAWTKHFFSLSSPDPHNLGLIPQNLRDRRIEAWARCTVFNLNYGHLSFKIATSGLPIGRMARKARHPHCTYNFVDNETKLAMMFQFEDVSGVESPPKPHSPTRPMLGLQVHHPGRAERRMAGPEPLHAGRGHGGSQHSTQRGRTRPNSTRGGLSDYIPRAMRFIQPWRT